MDLDLDILGLARGLASHAAARQAVIARNVANADTPGYRALDIAPFSESYDSNGDTWPGLRTTRPGHLEDGAEPVRHRLYESSPIGAESPDGNTVSLESQTLLGVEAEQAHQLALGVYRKSMDILRLGIGRGR